MIQVGVYSELASTATWLLIGIPVFVASFRSNYLLDARSWWVSAIYAALAAIFVCIWVIVSVALWKSLRERWAEYRRRRRAGVALAERRGVPWLPARRLPPVVRDVDE